MSIVPAGRVSRAVGPLLALLVACAVPAMAQMADCMDNARQTIDAGGTNGVASVFAVDLDGDGDIDVLSASTNDDTIAWYEAPLFVQHVISADADGASSVYAVDLDQDDDIDVLSASATDRTIAWYENDGSMPPRFVKPRVNHTSCARADATPSVGEGTLTHTVSSLN